MNNNVRKYPPKSTIVPLQLDVKTAFLDGELKETIYIHLPEGYRDSHKVTYLKWYIYGLT
jgi:hypothetical protein